MKVKSIVIPLLLSLFVIIINACQESNTVNISNDGEIVNGTLRGIFNYPN